MGGVFSTGRDDRISEPIKTARHADETVICQQNAAGNVDKSELASLRVLRQETCMA